MIRNTHTQWGSLAKFLHWTVALLVVGMLIVGLVMDDLPLTMKRSMIGVHKAIGVSLLALMAVRIVWRLMNPTPQLPSSTPAVMKLLAGGVHVVLYVLVIGMALSGWMYSNSAGYSVSWFGLFDVPNLVAKSESQRGLFHKIHEYAAWVLIATIAVHVGAALKHHFIGKNDILARMTPGVKPPQS